MESALPEQLPAGYRFHDRYSIESQLARTAATRIYRAIDTILGETVMIYVLSAELRTADGISQFRTRFQRARQKHRGRVYDYGEWRGVPYATAADVEGSEPDAFLSFD